MAYIFLDESGDTDAATGKVFTNCRLNILVIVS